eukprot:264330_1
MSDSKSNTNVEFSYTTFNNDYYLNLLSSNAWIQSLKINKDMMEQISSYANGMIKKCSNNKCNYEVLIYGDDAIKNANIFEYLNTSEDMQDSWNAPPLPTTKIPPQYSNNIFYFNPKDNITYCHDCSTSIKACNEGGFSRICVGILFAKVSDSYHACACKKRMCNMHHFCDNCNLAFCGESVTNIENCEDLCCGRACSTCGRGGCPMCVPMVDYDECMECDPPMYDGQVFKCHNNPNCQ